MFVGEMGGHGQIDVLESSIDFLLAIDVSEYSHNKFEIVWVVKLRSASSSC